LDGLERDADGNRFRWLPGLQIAGIGRYVTNHGRIDLAVGPPERSGLLRNRTRAEQREQVIAIERANRQWEEPVDQWKAAAFMRWHEPDKSRGLCPVL